MLRLSFLLFPFLLLAQAQDPHAFVGTQPAVDHEFTSIMLGGHDYRANGNTPLNSNVSTGSVAALGWTTPTNTDCPFCTPWNQQNILVLSLRHMSTVTPGVGLSILSNPGVDDFGGIWGFNVNTSNDGFRNIGSIFGGEINIGIDANGIDQPTIGRASQSIGFAVTESSVNNLSKRTSSLIGCGSFGYQNTHHCLSIAAAPGAQTPMDSGIVMTGPITIPIDLSGVKSGPVGIALPPGAGIQLGGGRLADLLTLPPTKSPTIYWCKDCIVGNGVCYTGGPGTLAVHTPNGLRCL